MLLLGRVFQLAIGLLQSYFIASIFPSPGLANLIVYLPLLLITFSTELHYEFYKVFNDSLHHSFVSRAFDRYLFSLAKDTILSALIAGFLGGLVLRLNLVDLILVVFILLADKVADELQRFWLIPRRNFALNVAIVGSRRLFLFVSILLSYFFFRSHANALHATLSIYAIFSIFTVLTPFLLFPGSAGKCGLLIRYAFLSFFRFRSFGYLLVRKVKALVLAFSSGQVLIATRGLPLIIPSFSSVSLLVCLQLASAISIIPILLFVQSIRHSLVYPRPRKFYILLLAKVVFCCLLANLVFLLAFLSSGYISGLSSFGGIYPVASSLDFLSILFVLVLSLSLAISSLASSCNEWLYSIRSRMSLAVLSMVGSIVAFLISFSFRSLFPLVSIFFFFASLSIYPLALSYALFSCDRLSGGLKMGS